MITAPKPRYVYKIAKNIMPETDYSEFPTFSEAHSTTKEHEIQVTAQIVLS